jgi:mRNA deadenylase 3'-5' endonuclease subunit Ccr4
MFNSKEVVQNIDEYEIPNLKFPSIKDDYKIYILRENVIDLDLLLEYLIVKPNKLVQSVTENFTQQVVNPWEVEYTDKFLERVLKFDKSTPSRIFPLIIREFYESNFQDIHFPNLQATCNPYFNSESTFKCVTILTFLSDHDAQGGCIFFPKLGTRIYAEKGKSVIFYNTTDTGETIMESMVGVSLVTKGFVRIMETSIRIHI